MKPQRVKQRVAKAVHIVCAFVLGTVIILGVEAPFYWTGYDWIGRGISNLIEWPIVILVGIYTVAILFSKTPVPFSRAGEENLRGYEAWCRTFGRAPSREEYVTDAWKNKSEFPPSSKVQLRIISSVNQIQGELLVVRSAAAFDRLVDEVRRQANSRTRPAAANCIIEPIVPEDMKIKCMYGLTVYRYEHQEIQAELVSALYETPDEKQAAKEAVGAALCRLQAKLNLPDPVRTPDGIYTWRR